jgi:hypothetical protein
MPKMITIHFSWSAGLGAGDRALRVEELLETMDRRFERCTSEYIRDYSNMLIIIDEAQMSYPFLNFWNDLIKPQAQNPVAGPFIILFSSFGSPGGDANLGDDITVSAPPVLTWRQRISIRPLEGSNHNIQLYFTEDEMGQMFDPQKINPTYSPSDRPFLVSEEVRKYIYRHVTGGHPGCTYIFNCVLFHHD